LRLGPRRSINMDFSRRRRSTEATSAAASGVPSAIAPTLQRDVGRRIPGESSDAVANACCGSARPQVVADPAASGRGAQRCTAWSKITRRWLMSCTMCVMSLN